MLRSCPAPVSKELGIELSVTVSPPYPRRIPLVQFERKVSMPIGGPVHIERTMTILFDKREDAVQWSYYGIARVKSYSNIFAPFNQWHKFGYYTNGFEM